MADKKSPQKVNKNILYTGSGDNGTTTIFHCDQGRISKSASIIEALGALDELNAYFGIVKVYSEIEQLKILIEKKKILYSEIIREIQQTLFVIQAEVAGSDMSVNKDNIKGIENVISTISKLLPPINFFTISGGSLLSAELDFSRTLARRAERRIVQIQEEGIKILNPDTITYMNRLSSVLFAMSRYANYLLSISEDHPKYNK